MSGWIVVHGPMGDPERLHVVPAEDDTGFTPDPVHQPSAKCGCGPRVITEPDLLGSKHEIVVHAAPD